MTLSELIVKLAELQEAGFGDRRVIDDNGNDVMEAVRPFDLAGTGDPDDAAIMLHCYVDYEHARQRSDERKGQA